MALIQTIADREAGGLLRTLYEAAHSRAGRIFNIVRAQSLNPPVLRAGIGLYQAELSWVRCADHSPNGRHAHGPWKTIGPLCGPFVRWLIRDRSAERTLRL